MIMNYTIELEQEEDGQSIPEPSIKAKLVHVAA